MAIDTSKILLGSGKIYIAELETDGSIPTDLVGSTNLIGDISGGAELSYVPTVYDVVNDDNVVRKSYITQEEVMLKSGVLTWDLTNLEKLTVGGTYTAAVPGTSPATLTIGGIKSVKQYAIAFVHTEEDFTVTVILKGSNQKGYSIKFDKEKEVVIDAEFKAIADANGILVTVTEEEIVA